MNTLPLGVVIGQGRGGDTSGLDDYERLTPVAYPNMCAV